MSISANCTVKSAEYKKGVLTVIVDFYTDLENLEANLILKFNQTLLLNPIVSTQFQIISNDLPLIVY